jgi:transcriptional regulator with GAF, ATPase, and Fis domain
MSTDHSIEAPAGHDRRRAKIDPRRQEDRDFSEVLDNHLRFEKLVSRLSADFVNLAPADVETAIGDVLGEINQFFKSDFANIIVADPDTGKMRVGYQWIAPHVDSEINFLGFELDRGAPYIAQQLPRGDPLIINRISEFPDEAIHERVIMQNAGLKSVLFVPFQIDRKVAGAVVINRLDREVDWPPELIPTIQLLGEIIGNALARKTSDLKLKVALTEIERLKDKLEAENVLLHQEIDILSRHAEIIGESPVLKSVINQAAQVAPLDSIVLIQGETGSGKELIANLIHRESPRGQSAMVRVNCASLPPTLIEAELFGREKGAYTGALSKQMGRFELADDSTLFLDEIGELPMELQAKMLRVLQEGEFERLGSSRTLKVDVRVIAATNRDLATLVAEGNFREDLYYRLNVFPIVVPPLRDRREDIPAMVWSFVRENNETMGKSIDRISKGTMQRLQAYDWPGNVRELRNVIERSMILSRGGALDVTLGEVENEQLASQTLAEVDRRHILAVVEQTGWRIRGDGGAAQILGLNPSTLPVSGHHIEYFLLPGDFPDSPV